MKLIQQVTGFDKNLTFEEMYKIAERQAKFHMEITNDMIKDDLDAVPVGYVISANILTTYAPLDMDDAGDGEKMAEVIRANILKEDKEKDVKIIIICFPMYFSKIDTSLLGLIDLKKTHDQVKTEGYAILTIDFENKNIEAILFSLKEKVYIEESRMKVDLESFEKKPIGSQIVDTLFGKRDSELRDISVLKKTEGKTANEVIDEFIKENNSNKIKVKVGKWS